MKHLMWGLLLCAIGASASTSLITGSVNAGGCSSSGSTTGSDLSLSCMVSDNGGYADATLSAHATPLDIELITFADGSSGMGGSAQGQAQEFGRYYFTGPGSGADIFPMAEFVGSQPNGTFSLTIDGIDYTEDALLGIGVPIDFRHIYAIQVNTSVQDEGGSNNGESSNLFYFISLPNGVTIHEAEVPEPGTLLLLGTGVLGAAGALRRRFIG